MIRTDEHKSNDLLIGILLLFSPLGSEAGGLDRRDCHLLEKEFFIVQICLEEGMEA